MTGFVLAIVYVTAWARLAYLFCRPERPWTSYPAFRRYTRTR